MEHTPDSVKPFLSREQHNLYRLIYARFLASQMKPAVFQTMTGGYRGRWGRHALLRRAYDFQRLRAVYVEGTDDEQETPESILPVLKEGSDMAFVEVDAVQHFTQPPARYTEASLVKTLEEKGIGRPSTYAPTITTIISRGYVTREKKRLYPTELGRMVTSMMTEYFGPDRGYAVYPPRWRISWMPWKRAKPSGGRSCAIFIRPLKDARRG